MINDYPLTKEYLQYLLEQAFSSFKKSMDVTLISPPGLGIMPYILFFLNRRELPLNPYPLLKTYLSEKYSKSIFIPINFNDILSNTFIMQFELYINNNPNIFGHFEVKTIPDLISIVTKLTANGYKFLFILDTLKDPRQLDQQTLKTLQSVTRVNTSQINVLYSFNNIEINSSNFDHRSIYKNIKYLKPFSLLETKHQVKHWFDENKVKFTSNERIPEIYNLSGGLAAFTKHFTWLLMDNPEAQLKYGDYEYAYIDQVVDIVKELGMEKGLSYLQNTGIKEQTYLMQKIQSKMLLLSNTYPLLKDLTLTENKLLELFKKYPEKIISRDEIAEAIWGTEKNTKYSDWTIDKHLNNLKKKVDAVYLIKTHKRQGFSLTAV